LSVESLIAELKRRRVFRVMAGYGVVAFGVLQVVEPVPLVRGRLAARYSRAPR
jgi:hypothetical protein